MDARRLALGLRVIERRGVGAAEGRGRAARVDRVALLLEDEQQLAPLFLLRRCGGRAAAARADRGRRGGRRRGGAREPLLSLIHISEPTRPY